MRIRENKNAKNAKILNPRKFSTAKVKVIRYSFQGYCVHACVRIHMHLGAHAVGDEAGAAALTANGPIRSLLLCEWGLGHCRDWPNHSSVPSTNPRICISFLPCGNEFHMTVVTLMQHLYTCADMRLQTLISYDLW